MTCSSQDIRHILGFVICVCCNGCSVVTKWTLHMIVFAFDLLEILDNLVLYHLITTRAQVMLMQCSLMWEVAGVSRARWLLHILILFMLYQRNDVLVLVT